MRTNVQNPNFKGFVSEVSNPLKFRFGTFVLFTVFYTPWENEILIFTHHITIINKQQTKLFPKLVVWAK